MSQPYSTPDDDSHDKSAIRLATNDFPLDWKKATIYKYTIHVSPKDITTKEKKVLAKAFVSRLKTSLINSTFVHNDNLEFFFPNLQPGLENKFFQVVRFYQKDAFDGAVISYVHGKKLYTKLLIDELITRPAGQDPFDAGIGGGDRCLTLCTVQAKMEVIDARYIKESLRSTREQQRAVVSNAFDNILQQEARDTPSVQVYGNRIFDVSLKPAMEGPVVELRRGVNVETCAVNSSFVRRVTPCMGFFLKSMKVSELLRLLCSTDSGTGPSLTAEQVENALTGVRIRKTYGKQEVAPIEGFTVGTPEQETFYWNNHKTTTISHYMEKVYHAEDVNKYPEQKCVVIGSLKRLEILPCSVCSVLPGQYFPLPASSGYFGNDVEQDYHGYLRDIPNSYVSLTDGLLSKTLKCSASPTIAAEFGLQVSGIGERPFFKGNRGHEYKRLTEARTIETQITASRESPEFEQPVLMLVFASSDLQELKTRFGEVFNKHAPSTNAINVSSHPVRSYDDSGVGSLIADAQGGFAETYALAGRCRPAIIGVFRKTQRSGEIMQQDVELQGLRCTYEALKLHCHRNGFRFVGTFLPQAFDSQDDHKMEMVVSNVVQRLRTQIKSAGPSAYRPVSMCGRRGALLLGIHVSRLDPSSGERDRDNDSDSPYASAERAPYWYVVSLVAKWSRSKDFHRVRTFLQKSCKPQEGFPRTFPGALAMTQIEKTIHELLGGVSLRGCMIVVLRAGISAGHFRPEEKAAVESVRLKQAADIEAGAANLASLDLPASEAEGGSNGTLDELTGIEEKATAEDQQPGMTSGCDNELNSFHPTSKSDSHENSNEPAERHTVRPKSVPNPELHCFLEFAKREAASLAYVETSVNTLFRLFQQEGQPVCVRENSTIEDNQRNSVGSETVSSVLVTPSSADLVGPPVEWMIQKRLPKKAGPSTPVSLGVHCGGHGTIQTQHLRALLAHALWDFPGGTWSSKNFSCVTLAMKANRHAKRVVRYLDGEPVLADVHADLKDSLYFI
jgi:hypothetical protein